MFVILQGLTQDLLLQGFGVKTVVTPPFQPTQIIEDTNGIDASESIIGGLRQLNIVFNNSVFSTNNFLDMGGHRIRMYAIDKTYYTIPVYIDSSTTPCSSTSAKIDGKVFDLALSGPNNSYCLTVFNPNRSTTPIRYVSLDNIRLPVNNSGDLILFEPTTSNIITKETIIFWFGQPMRFVLIDNEWLAVVGM